jgi:CBS domain containing-hemolysin-like protein
MTPLLLFLLGVIAVYVSTVTTAFSALMRLSLRLLAEGGGRSEPLRRYLDEPLRLFIPGRFILAIITVVAAGLLARVTGVDAARGLPLLILGTVLFVLICEHIAPLAIVRRNPERVLEVLLPSFETIARILLPLTVALHRLAVSRKERSGTVPIEPETPAADVAAPQGDSDDLQQGQARELLRSLVEFRETMVREVMTPRPDVIAIEAKATIGDLIALAREQQYSRVPVFNESLDNIVGFITIKDLIQLEPSDLSQPITPLIRPAHFVPESKRVPELLKEFQRKRIQAAVVVDEYGGTAGLVTIEDLLEEIVGEIRDEYDVEVEPVLAEQDGSFVFSGRTHVRELAERLKIDVENEGYETVGGYLLAHVGRVPHVGEAFELDGLAVEVLEAERRRITRVRVRRLEGEPAVAGETTE